MKAMLKFTFRNIIRLPLRAFLCFFIAFSASAVIAVCFNVSDGLREVLKTLEEQYPAVVTVSRQSVITPDGTKMPSGQFLTSDDAERLGKSKSVKAYNITLFAGKLAQEEIIDRLPDESFLDSPPKERIVPDAPENVRAVNNLLLTEAFFCKDSQIVSGSLFGEEEMRGGIRATVISRTTAERLALSVGDCITFDFENSGSFALYHIVGIYESKRGISDAYIPLADYYRDAAIFLQGKTFADSQAVRLDKTVRLDFLLKSPTLGEMFIRDALNNGFDTANFDININDRPYLVLSDGLENILSLSEILSISVLTAGISVLFITILFFVFSRKRESAVLNALGMKRSHIRMMFTAEFLFIIAVAVFFGILSAGPLSRTAFSEIEQTVLSERTKDANKAEETDKSAVELTLQRDIHLSFSDTDVGLTGDVFLHSVHLEEGRQGFREEIFWSNQTPVHLTGRTHFSASGFENTASYDKSICAESHRLAGYVFSCYAPEESGFSVGDLIPVSPQKEKESVVLSAEDGKIVIRNREVSAYLIVAGTYRSSENSGRHFMIPMKELELLCEYFGISGKNFDNIRYDLITEEKQ